MDDEPRIVREHLRFLSGRINITGADDASCMFAG
jgi:hypothetical protein